MASLVKKLVTQVPFAFIQGAIGGFSLFGGALAFTGVWITFGGTLVETMRMIFLLNGVGIMLIESYRIIEESYQKLSEHAKWIYDPHGMFTNATQDTIQYYFKLTALCFLSGAAVTACIEHPETLANLWNRVQTVLFPE
jgi:hypothetical protein